MPSCMVDSHRPLALHKPVKLLMIGSALQRDKGEAKTCHRSAPASTRKAHTIAFWTCKCQIESSLESLCLV